MNGSKSSSSAEVVQKVPPSNETQTQLEQDKNRETDSVHIETQEKLTEEKAKYTPEQVVTEHLKNMVESGKLSPETISVLETDLPNLLRHTKTCHLAHRLAFCASL